MTTRVSLAELLGADIQLCPDEAAAVVAEVCRQYSAGRLAAFPSPGIIRLTRDGEVVAQGPMATEAASVARAAHLLEDLLPPFEAPAAYRASGGLRLVIARALGTLDLPPYRTLDEFTAALDRFVVPDLASSARRLYRRWEQERVKRTIPAPSAALTISDIRRARRATGLTLDDLSMVADVPPVRLRELEWGYFRNWPADAESRARVVRYARAAGLDEDIVLSIAWPMIEEASTGLVDTQVEADHSTALVHADAPAVITVEPMPAVRAPSRVTSWVVAAGAAALLALGTFALTLESSNRAAPIQAEAVNVPPAPRETPPTDPPAAAAVPAVKRPSPARPSARPAPQKKRATSRIKGFFGRELFRIVIR